MTIEDRIRDEKLQHDINRETANQQYLHYDPEKLINPNILQAKISRHLIKVE